LLESKNAELLKKALLTFNYIFDTCVAAEDSLHSAVRKAGFELTINAKGELELDLSLCGYQSVRKIMLFLYMEADIKAFMETRPDYDFSLAEPVLESVAEPVAVSGRPRRQKKPTVSPTPTPTPTFAAALAAKDAKKAARKKVADEKKAAAIDERAEEKLRLAESRLLEFNKTMDEQSQLRETQAFESGLNLQRLGEEGGGTGLNFTLL
jgi:hypothetical protein